LSGNSIHDERWRSLYEALRVNTSLASLHLGGNSIVD